MSPSETRRRDSHIGEVPKRERLALTTIDFKTVRDAQLFLIARPSFEISTFGRFLESEGETWSRSEVATEAENLVEVAGRVCYMSFSRRQSPKSNSEYIGRLIEQGHESVLEHVSWSFILTGVSRAFTHQFVRHRVGFAYSQLSQQYRDQSQTALIEPLGIAADPALSRVWRSSMRQALAAYRQLIGAMESELLSRPGAQRRRELERRIRSSARSVLPEAVETKVAFTANARALRHFLEIRGAILGDDEMRIVSALVFKAVQREAPALFADFALEMLDGLPIVRRLENHRKSSAPGL